MRWSSILKENTKEQEGEVTILDYTPKQFNFGTPEAALTYIQEKD